jgi:regulator of cell morphogenesis and NO signaling
MDRKVFSGQDKIGDIVTVFPGASNILKRYAIDFCCGGGRPISHAFQEKNLNQDQVLAELNDAYELAVRQVSQDKDWREAPMSELIEYVVQKHHAFLQQELPVIGEFVTKILRVHGPNHGDSLSPLHRLFHTLKTELDQHLISEETLMFPLVVEYEKNPNAETLRKAQAAIADLESEHSGAGDLLKQMREVTRDYTLPDGACRTYTLAFQKLEALESDLFEHIHLENNILFPRVMDIAG